MIPLSSVQLSINGKPRTSQSSVKRSQWWQESRGRKLERHAHNAGAAEDNLGLSCGRDPHNSASAAVRTRHIKISVAIQSEPLPVAEPRKKTLTSPPA